MTLARRPGYDAELPDGLDMPLYEYECDACGQRFELIRKFSDPPVTSCTACNGSVRKLLSSPAIQFKGSGWYVTDYARKPAAGEGESAKSAGDADEKSAPEKKESEKKAASAESSSSSSGKSGGGKSDAGGGASSSGAPANR